MSNATKTAAGTKLRIEIYNLIGKIDGRTCAVGTGWMCVKYTADGRRMGTVRQFGADESAARAYLELWNGP